jgi:hypothetical protein
MWKESPFKFEGHTKGAWKCMQWEPMNGQVVCPLPFEWPYSCLGMPYALWNTYAWTPYKNEESGEKGKERNMLKKRGETLNQ